MIQPPIFKYSHNYRRFPVHSQDGHIKFLDPSLSGFRRFHPQSPTDILPSDEHDPIAQALGKLSQIPKLLCLGSCMANFTGNAATYS